MAETIKKINETLCDHLQKHEDVYDKAIDRHEKALFGEDGRDGLSLSTAKIETKLITIEKLLYGLIILVLGAAVVAERMVPARDLP